MNPAEPCTPCAPLQTPQQLTLGLVVLWGCPALVRGRVQPEGASRRCEARGSYCTPTLLPPALVVTLWGWGLHTKPVGPGRAASRKVLGVSSLCWPQRS